MNDRIRSRGTSLRLARRALAILTLSGLITLAGCENAVQPVRAPDLPATFAQQSADRPAPPPEPVLRNEGPAYPAAVLYILYREYIHKNPGLTSLSPDDPKYQQYIERRLRQLYPDRGHSGMMRAAAERHRQHRLAWLEYERAMREYELRYGPTEEYLVQPLMIESTRSRSKLGRPSRVRGS